MKTAAHDKLNFLLLTTTVALAKAVLFTTLALLFTSCGSDEHYVDQTNNHSESAAYAVDDCVSFDKGAYQVGDIIIEVDDGMYQLYKVTNEKYFFGKDVLHHEGFELLMQNAQGVVINCNDYNGV